MPELPTQPSKQLAEIADGTEGVIVYGYFHQVLTVGLDKVTTARELSEPPFTNLNRQTVVKVTLPTTTGEEFPCFELTLPGVTKYYYPEGEFGFNPRNKE